MNPIGMIFEHDNQPYGLLKVKIEKAHQFTEADLKDLGPYQDRRRLQYLIENQCIELTGTVIEGTSRSKMFQHRVVNSAVGNYWNLVVTPADLAKGRKTTVACG